MEKKKIETFIKKYSLGGMINSAIWRNEAKDLVLTAMTSDKKLFSSVKLENGADGFIDGVEVGVMTTDRLKKMLAVSADNIALTLDVDTTGAEKRVRQILIDDTKISMAYVTSEPSAFDPIPSMKNVPPFEIEINLNQEFIDSFNKAFSSLSDDGTLFTLIMSKKKKKLELVLGYRQNLSDRIAMEVDAVAGKDAVKNPISFSAKSLKEILSANNDSQATVLKVSEAGLASISFDVDGIKSQYYLVKVAVED